MKKLRRTSWFFLLVILLAIFVSFTMAQETPTAAGGQVFQRDLSESRAGETLTRSAEEIQIELSADGGHSLSLPAASVNLSPMGWEDGFQEPPDPPGPSVLPLPDDSQISLAPPTEEAVPVVTELSTQEAKQRPEFSGQFVVQPGPTAGSTPPSADASCQQQLVNPQLNVEDDGQILGWSIIFPIVHKTDNPNLAYDGYSLILEDGDIGDPDPAIDMFAQGFLMPYGLAEISVEYMFGTLGTNSSDDAYGELWLLDDDWVLHLDDPATYFVGGWTVAESEGVWAKQTILSNDPSFLNKMAGKKMAILLFNITDGGGATEWVLFDDVTLTACYEDLGQIIIKKETDPNGASQKFTFDSDWSSNFQLSDGQSKASGALAPGTYSVSELPVSGWTQTSATCDDGSNPGSISLQAGETVTCTFHNKKANDAYIIVKKQTDPAGASQKFTFDSSWSGSFELAGGGSKTSQALAPGSYSVKESVPSGWELESAACSDGSAPNNISLQQGETVTCTFKNKKLEAVQICNQMLVNTKLDIVEFGDGTGTAEPWSIIAPIVYYTDNPNLAYDGYSLILEDGDSGDPNPGIDMFAQGFVMPDGLAEISIEYLFATLGTNSSDEVYGQLWLLDDDWVLHFGDPDTYFVGGWTVAESEGAWAKQTILSNDPSFLNKMAGKKTAILLFNITDNGGVKKEEVFFDNIMFTACSEREPASGKAFMPSIMHNFGEGKDPICNPPSEQPFDQWHSNRGLVQTGATCSSSLSNVDLKDYYTFKPRDDGNHTLWLTDLAEGTNWAASIWVLSAKPVYAPGGSKDGYCLASQKGDGDKQVVCNLKKDTEYFVRVDSGDPPVGGSYNMKVTIP